MPDFEILKAENCPRELKKRLKKEAIERECDLQDLVVEYCRSGVEKAEAERAAKVEPRPQQQSTT